jgi:L,D-peptidoglycan transpeptidase YkuD (ErfK/YbiS/YcfS/YnhG family)
MHSRRKLKGRNTAISWENRVAADGIIDRIIVRGARSDPSHGLLVAGPLTVPCALGRSGVTRHKREGDGATPAGRLRLISCHYRPDRISRPATRLPTAPISRLDGWCDDPADRSYNRPVPLPYPASHEVLWREDMLYDVLVVLDWNLLHPRPGAGSAIFFHLAAPGMTPTAGCIAVTLPTMRKILALSGPETYFDVS